MKAKKYFLTTILLIIVQFSFSQGELQNCIIIEEPSGLCEQEFTHSVDQNYLDNLDPVVFNVFIWDIREDLGGGQGPPLSENQALAAVAQLNIKFNPYKIFFKYHGFDIIYNSTLYDIQGRSDLYNAVTNNSYE